MIEVSSFREVLVQCAVLAVLGALLVPLVHLLRFRKSALSISRPRESSLWALAAIGVGWMLVISLFLVAAGNGTSESEDSQDVSPTNAEDVVGQLLVALIAVGPALIVMRGRGESLASAGVSAKNLGRSSAVGVLLISAFVIWHSLVPGGGEAISPARMTRVWPLLQFTVVGFAEEFAFRGYLQTRLVAWLGQYRGWILASVLMAMGHIGHRVAGLRMGGGEALISSASLIPISLFLGYVMLRTQNIVAPALLHTAINWLDL